ncbi:hypothetical protein [Anaerosporobacter sp.]
MIDERKLIEDIRKIELEILKDKTRAIECEDEFMALAIDNQLNILSRIKGRINSQPTIENICEVSAKWIPVLERLPDETGYYRCSVEWYGTSTKKLLLKSGYEIENRLMDIHFLKSSNSFKENTEFCTYEVIAWKPLEEPYIENNSKL